MLTLNKDNQRLQRQRYLSPPSNSDKSSSPEAPPQNEAAKPKESRDVVQLGTALGLLAIGLLPQAAQAHTPPPPLSQESTSITTTDINLEKEWSGREQHELSLKFDQDGQFALASGEPTTVEEAKRFQELKPRLQFANELRQDISNEVEALRELDNSPRDMNQTPGIVVITNSNAIGSEASTLSYDLTSGETILYESEAEAEVSGQFVETDDGYAYLDSGKAIRHVSFSDVDGYSLQLRHQVTAEKRPDVEFDLQVKIQEQNDQTLQYHFRRDSNKTAP